VKPAAKHVRKAVLDKIRLPLAPVNNLLDACSSLGGAMDRDEASAIAAVNGRVRLRFIQERGVIPQVRVGKTTMRHLQICKGSHRGRCAISPLKPEALS
jgi:hypothetical protein